MKDRGIVRHRGKIESVICKAMGLVNDHAADCMIWPEVERARKSFKRPLPR